MTSKDNGDIFVPNPIMAIVKIMDGKTEITIPKYDHNIHLVDIVHINSLDNPYISFPDLILNGGRNEVNR